MKKEKPFNAPFLTLKGLQPMGKKRPPKADPKKDAPEKSKKVQPEYNDRKLFIDAMKGVEPIKNDRITIAPPDHKSTIEHIRQNTSRQDKEVMDTLRALVKGEKKFDIISTGEYIEGHVVPLDTVIMKKLRCGEFSIQAHLDLHGYIKTSALNALRMFIQNCHACGNRSLLVIHGRGLKSSNGPVIKDNIVRWLTTGWLSHIVLAFCSARPCDGGTGALYILLKKRPRKLKWKKPL